MKKVCCIVLLGFIMLLGCNAPNSNSIQKDELYEFEIYDSIVCNINDSVTYYPVTKLFNDKILHKNMRGDIVINSLDGKVISSFNKIGNAADNYSAIKSIAIINDTVVVQSRKAYVYYTLQGEHIKNSKRFDQFHNASHSRWNTPFYYNNNNERCFISIRLWGDVCQNDFYSQKIFSVLNESDSTITDVIVLDSNSMYHDKELYYREIFPEIFVDKKEHLMYMLMPYETKLYVYDIDKDFKLIETINTNPDFFDKPEGISKTNYSMDKELILLQTNDRYFGINIYDSLIFLEYQTGIPKDKAFTSMSQINSSNNMHIYSKHYVEIINLNNKKSTIKDILLKNSSGTKLGMFDVKNLDSIYLYRYYPKKSENEPSIIYLARLKKVAEE